MKSLWLLHHIDDAHRDGWLSLQSLTPWWLHRTTPFHLSWHISQCQSWHLQLFCGTRKGKDLKLIGVQTLHCSMLTKALMLVALSLIGHPHGRIPASLSLSVAIVPLVLLCTNALPLILYLAAHSTSCCTMQSGQKSQHGIHYSLLLHYLPSWNKSKY